MHPFETDTKGRLLVVDVSVNWATDRHWQTKVLDTGKVTRLDLLRQDSVDDDNVTVAVAVAQCCVVVCNVVVSKIKNRT